MTELESNLRQMTYFFVLKSFGTTKSLKMEAQNTKAAPFAACSRVPSPMPAYIATNKRVNA
jgi:hypothetical protein